jgi:Zn finger protein HypA/HybF involved in hydrogenase expression
MEAETTTIVCDDCAALYDVQTGWTTGAAENKPLKVRCPKRAKHNIHKWEAGGPCPKCGTAMKIDEGGLAVLWD